MLCHGNAQDHCCHIDGRECQFLERDTAPGRHYACGLLRELGSWDTVHADARYLANVQPMWDRLGGACGTFPRKDETCHACGVIGG